MRVALGRKKQLEIRKECIGDIPSERSRETFTFQIRRGEQPFAGQVYTLRKTDGTLLAEGKLYATDAEGRFTLRDGETAVFEDLPVLSDSDYTVVEEENIFWSSSVEEAENEERISRIFLNRFRPVVYVKKQLTGTPDFDPGTGEKTDFSEASFTFRLLDESGAGMKADYLYVKSARTDGSTPETDFSKGENGKGQTAEDGSFTIKAGEVIALLLDHPGQKYIIQEVTENKVEEAGLWTVNDGTGDNWVVRNPKVSGTAGSRGTLAVITNIYRWKELLLRKEILHRPETAALSDDTEFTFRLLKEDGSPAAGIPFQMEKEGGAGQFTGVTGIDGSFTAACAGRTVRFSHLEAGQSYIIQEEALPEDSDYVMVNDGRVTVLMPLYAPEKKAAIMNAWTKRPLYISKLVVTEAEELQAAAKDQQFRFVVEIDGEAYADQPYTVTRNGRAVAAEIEPVTVSSPGWPGNCPSGLRLENTEQKTSFPGASYVRVTFAAGSGTEEGQGRVLLQGLSGSRSYSRYMGGSDLSSAVYTVPGDTVILSIETAGSGSAGFSADLVPLDVSGRQMTADQTVIDSDRSFRTDEEGSLYLRSGETAMFSDAGMNGLTAYAVSELHEDGELFQQIYPEENRASTGIITGSNTTARFINGTEGLIMLSKNVIAGAGDNGMGESQLKAEQEAAAADRNAAGSIVPPAHFKIEYWNNDSWYPLRLSEFMNLGISEIDPDGKIRKISTYTERRQLYTDERLTVPAGFSYLLSGSFPNGAVRLRITEAEEDQSRICRYSDELRSGYVHYGVSVSGGTRILEDIRNNPVAVITNELEGLDDKSVIFKKLRSLQLPEEDEQLQLTVERYDGLGWEPAEGIACYERYDVLQEGRWQVSDQNGTVTMEVRSGEIPALVFPYETVVINPSSPEPGTLRISEAAGRQGAWGCLQGYALSGGETGKDASLGLQDADTFVNDSLDAEIRVQKVLPDGVDAAEHSFAFRIELVTAVSAEIPFDQLKAADLTQLAEGTGLQYEVYSAETDSSSETPGAVRSGTVDRGGIFTLKGGEYAVFHVTQGSLWRVQETANVPGFRLESARGSLPSVSRAVSAGVVLLKAESRPVITLVYNDDTAAVERAEIVKASDLPVPEDNGIRKNGYDFTGWYADSECTTKVSGAFKEDVTLYGGWKKNHTIKYAVQIYGIQQDVDETGQLLGLTFGPAHGYELRTSARSHTPGPGKKCIHDLTWKEIISQSSEDPTVFSECLEQECTHSVNIVLNETLLAGDYWGTMPNGDGASVLYASVKAEFRSYNSEAFNTGGWPASRIRGVLNGADSYTNTEIAGSDVPNAASSLLSCFPRELQMGIAARAVKSDTVWNSHTEGTVTTYDRLWLPSLIEIYADSEKQVRVNEGETYPLISLRGITTENMNGNMLWGETGSSTSYWTRSISSIRNTLCYRISGAGQNTLNPAVRQYGLAPGFCIR